MPTTDSIFGRTGGAYLPPAKLRALQAGITDKSSEDYQRLTWEALKKSINGLINKVNVSNIKNIVPELFSENLIRGRGLFCKCVMKAQQAFPPFTPVYSCMVAVLNTKFPVIGELLLNRLISQFRKAYKRSDKQVCLAASKFLAHLVNQQVANEIVALQILTLLLERPTDDSVEVAVGFMREVGAYLLQESSKACTAVFERFRAILHEGKIDKRTQYMVEVLFQVRKEKFKNHPILPEELDIIEEEDQITHQLTLSDELKTEDYLNVFKFDENFLENERQYMEIKKEILGDESEEESGAESGEGEEEEMDEEQIEEERQLQIKDQTNTNLVNLRRAIYLTIMSSLNFEECAHKLLKIDIPQGQEVELCNMIIECCSQEKTYVNFYGLLGERFCRISETWAQSFAKAFEDAYKTIHRYETNRIRNIGKYFSHLLASDALTWEVFALIHLTEADTTSSSRIFCKILFTELVEAMGLKKLNERLQDSTMVISIETSAGTINRGVFDGLFPKENPRDTRFAINYFTSIGLGALTENLREWLKNAPKVAPVASSSESESSSESDSSSSASDSDSSSSDDDEPPRMRHRSKSPDDNSEDEKSRFRRKAQDSDRENERRKSIEDERRSIEPPDDRDRRGRRERSLERRERSNERYQSRRYSRERGRDMPRERSLERRDRYQSRRYSRERGRDMPRERSISRDGRDYRSREYSRERDRSRERYSKRNESRERDVEQGSMHPDRQKYLNDARKRTRYE